MLWVLTGVMSAGSVPLVVGVGAVTTLLGGGLLASRDRVFGAATYCARVLLGSITICLVLLGSGQAGHGPPTMLFGYVGVIDISGGND